MKLSYIVCIGIAAISLRAQPLKRPYVGCPVVEHVTPEEYGKRTRPFQFTLEKTQEGVWAVCVSAEHSAGEFGEAKSIRVIISNIKPPEENTKEKDFGYIYNAQKDIAKTYEVPLPSKDRPTTLRLVPVRSLEMPRAILIVRYDGKDGTSEYVVRLCRFAETENANKSPEPTPGSVTPAASAPAAPPSAQRPITGYYTSTPVREYPQYADGKSHVDTEELILILSPDGTFVTWFQMYSDGDPVQFSGLAPYDLQSNANGTWRFADGRLFLHGIGPSYIVTKWQMGAGGSFPPQEDEATAVYRDGHWVVAWRQTEYTI